MWIEIFVAVFILIYIYFKRAHNYWKNLGVPQLEPIFPFGDMASVIFRKNNMGDKIKQIYDYGRSKGHKYIGLYFFSRKAFLPIDPHLVKSVLAKDFQHFNDRGIYYDEVHDPLSAHLFSLAGPKWKNLRAKLTPAYSPGKLKFMFYTILDVGKQMVDVLKERTSTGEPVEIRDLFARYSTDVIGSCAFGIDCNSLKNPSAEFRLMGKRAFTQTVMDSIKVIIIRSMPSFARILRIGIFSSTVTNFFRKVVEDTINYREKNNVTRNDFLQLLIMLKNNGNLDDDPNDCETKQRDLLKLTTEEAAAQAFIFFLAGFETTSTTMSFALFEMALNEDIQKKAREEIEEVLLKCDGKFTYEAMMQMRYLETVILETMRKYPPAPVFLRKCTKSFKIPETNVIIEEGLSVLIPAYGLHRDQEYFPDPERFDPDRFNEENKSKIWDYTYIPFGDGPRICIGMRFAMIQLKVALSLLLKNYKITINERTRLPIKMETRGIIIAPIGGLWLNLQQL